MKTNTARVKAASCITFYVAVCVMALGVSSCSAGPAAKNEKVEGEWFVNFVHKDIGQANTVITLTTESNTFEARSRKNADRDILGNWTSFLARTFTKGMKNGSLLRIEQGIFKERGDTVFLAGILITPMGQFNVEGHIAGEILHAEFRSKGRGYLGEISGTRDVPGLPLQDYPQLFRAVASTAESKIFNPRVLESREWRDYIKEMTKSTPKFQDDLEMVFASFYRAKDLPFSHFALMKPVAPHNDSADNGVQNTYLTLEEKSENTAYLKIASFSGSAREVDSIFDVIHDAGYENLIVDLRNNSGGSVEAGMAFAKNVILREAYGGIFLTQKWFKSHEAPPPLESYGEFEYFTEANFDLIIEGIHEREGLCLKITPNDRVYEGNLLILTNRNTASTCEPIVYELQRQGRAVAVGETTAGAMLNGEMFELPRGFKVFIPTADYYTSDGYRIDQNGVVPDIETTGEDALEAAVEMLRGE